MVLYASVSFRVKAGGSVLDSTYHQKGWFMLATVRCLWRYLSQFSCLVPLAVSCSVLSGVVTASQTSKDWIRGELHNMEMRIQCEILDVDGQPAQDPSISVAIRDNNSSQAMDVKLDGHRCDVWLPAHRADWHSLQIQAESRDAKRRASVSVMRPALRQIAMNGLILTLHPSARTVKAKLVHDNTPVANANLDVQTSSGAMLHFLSDEAGGVEIGLLPDERISSLTAWTDEPLFGGFQFSRGPVRDPNADTQTIELFACREQKIRVVDGQGNPCTDLVMFLQVATPAPNFNFLGSIQASRMVTNQDGEAVFDWFPDWEEVHCYVDLNSEQWVIDGESKWIDGDFVVQVKPRMLRRTVFGKLDCDEGARAGYCVFWRSFQGEQEGRSDFITSVTDEHGSFAADVLPDATYCVFINDTRDVSDMVDLIPAPTNDRPAATAILHLQKPETLSIAVTAGKARRPIANQPVYVRQTHDYQWIEDGKQRSGSSARDSYVYTDELGKATAAVESGKDVRLSIYNADWQTSQELPIIAGQQNAVALHREIDQPRAVFGVVLQDASQPVSTDDIVIIAGSIDGETRGHEELAVREDGVFQMQTQATAVGALAIAKNRSMAGVVLAENPNRIMRLQLQPTKQLDGRLVDSKGNPIGARTVHATLRLMNTAKDRDFNRFYGFEVDRQKVKTDADGYFSFEGMPIGAEILLRAENASGQDDHWLGSVELKANEEHAVETHTLNE